MKVAIIGAGVAGLSAGCYLQMNGFDTEIFETGSYAGGLCQGWTRGDYKFNGCIQWLLGSNESSPFYKLWSELIDMNSLHFIHHDVRMIVETRENLNLKGNRSFHLYTDIAKLSAYLKALAPEDNRQITKFIYYIRRLQKYEIPPKIQSVPRLLPLRQKISYIKHLPLLLFLKRYQKITNKSFARKLKNPFLREAFDLLFDGNEMPLLVITMPMAFYDRQGAGYPLGGSGNFVEKITERYRVLNGKLHLNSPVEKILTEQHKAKGLLLRDGSSIFADFIISTADWHFTILEALGGNFVTKKMELLLDEKKLQIYYSIFSVYLGLKENFTEYPPVLRFPLKTSIISPDGTKYDRMEMHVYNYDPTLAPVGKTVVSFCLYTREGDYWISLRKKDKERYTREKEAFSREIIDAAEQKIGRIRLNIEEIDVVTPATIHRYTNNRKGSTQGWLPGENMIAPSPIEPEIRGLQNFYYAGHWAIPGGGLPVAIKSARDVAMMICHKTGKTFEVKKYTQKSC